MAKAYQCDRCMNYYTENKDVVPRGMATNDVVNGLRIVTKTSKIKHYELCDDCLKKLVNFLEYRSEI